jgi:hypothetical protein
MAAQARNILDTTSYTTVKTRTVIKGFIATVTVTSVFIQSAPDIFVRL